MASTKLESGNNKGNLTQPKKPATKPDPKQVAAKRSGPGVSVTFPKINLGGGKEVVYNPKTGLSEIKVAPRTTQPTKQQAATSRTTQPAKQQAATSQPARKLPTSGVSSGYPCAKCTKKFAKPEELAAHKKANPSHK